MRGGGAKMFEHILLENDGYGEQKPKMKNTQKSCKVRLINGFWVKSTNKDKNSEGYPTGS